MPTGFNTPSGTSLPERLVPVAPRLLAYLLNGMKDGTITADKPTTGAAIIEIARRAKHNPVDLRGADVRALVNSLRIDGHPIGSTMKGYFYARNADELTTTLTHLLERERAMARARRGLENAFKQPSLTFQHPNND